MRRANLHTVYIPINRVTGWKHFNGLVNQRARDCLFLLCGHLAPVKSWTRTALASLLLCHEGNLEMSLLFPQEKHVNMVHIESRKSRRRSSEVEIFVDCECGKTEFNELIQLLKFQTTIVTLNPPENVWTEEEGKTSFSLSGDLAIWQMLQTRKIQSVS